MSAERRRAALPYAALIVGWVVVHAALMFTTNRQVFDGELIGPDSYMRFVRVLDLWDGNGWYANAILDSNVPFGDELHWTRPFDALIVAIAFVPHFFVGAESALYWASALISPLLHLGTLLLMVWAARPLLAGRGAFVAGWVLLPQVAFLLQNGAGRGDHHSLQLLLLVLGIGLAVRALRPQAPARWAWWAGIVGGVAVWVAVESLFMVAVMVVVMGAAWLRQGNGRLTSNIAFASGFASMIALALVLERPLGDLAAVEYDRISIAHLGFAAVLLLVWLAVRIGSGLGLASDVPRDRGLLGAGSGAAGFVGLVAVLPGIVGSPFADLDPRIGAVFFDHIRELDPLLPTDLRSAGQFLFALGSGVAALAFVSPWLWHRRHHDDWESWLLVAGLSLVFVVLALQHVRFTAFAQVPLTLVIAGAIMQFARWANANVAPTARPLAIGDALWVLVLGFPVLGVGILSAAGAEAPNDAHLPSNCALGEAAEILNDVDGVGDQRHVLLTSVFHAPEILYRTDHAVIAGPYHRNDRGILDVYDALRATDDAVALDVIARRGVDVIFLCPSQQEVAALDADDAPASLYSRLRQGEVPRWLTPIETDDTDRFLFFAVRDQNGVSNDQS
ncbi:MAG TPA: hypothetical protein QGF05_02020 [Dehalococcoidia bacterium]|nr:hypothetical protein [Dehalococcoidia bacterium]